MSNANALLDSPLDNPDFGQPFGAELMVPIDTVHDLGELACIVAESSSNDDWSGANDDQLMHAFTADKNGDLGSISNLN